METDKILHGKDDHQGGVPHDREVPYTQTPELDPSVWPDVAQYELYKEEVDAWTDEAMVNFMGEYPQFYDKLEAYFDIAKKKTLSDAQHAGKKTREYFLKRVQFELFQPLEKLKNEAALADVVMQTPAKSAALGEPALTAENAVASETQEGGAQGVEVPADSVEHSVKFNRLLKYQEMMKKSKGITPVQKLTENGASQNVAQKQVRSVNNFSALQDLITENPELAPLQNVSETVVRGETESEEPAHQDAPAAIEAVLAPEDGFSVPETEGGENVPPPVAEASIVSQESQSLEERVKRSINNGSFDLALATGPQLEALLAHPDSEIQKRAKEVLKYRESGHPLSTELPYIDQWTVKSETEQHELLAKVREDFQLGRKYNIRNVDTGAIERWKLVDIEDNGAVRLSVDGRDSRRAYQTMNVLELLESNPEQIGSRAGVVEKEVNRAEVNRPVPEVLDEQEDSVVPIEEKISDIPQEDLNQQTLEMLTAQEPTADEIRRDQISVYRSRWAEMTDEERQEMSEDCKKRFLADRTYNIKHTDGHIEQSSLLNILEDGTAIFAQGNASKKVDLLELLELNPIQSPEAVQEEPREAAPLHENNEPVSGENIEAWTPQLAARSIAIARKYQEQIKQGLSVPEQYHDEAYEEQMREEYLKLGGDPAKLESMILDYEGDAIDSVLLHQDNHEAWKNAGRPYDTIVPVGEKFFIKHSEEESWVCDTREEAYTVLARITGQQVPGASERIELESPSTQAAIPETLQPETVNTSKEQQSHFRDGREAEFAAAKERFDQMTKLERDEFVGDCEFHYPIDSKYEIVHLDGTVEVLTLRAVSTTGMALLENALGQIDQIPLLEFGTLCKEIESAKYQEDASREDNSVLMDDLFENEYGINERDLTGIAEFMALSEGQQLLVRHELNNYAVSQVKTDALKEYREKFNALQIPRGKTLTEEERAKLGFIGKSLESLKSDVRSEAQKGGLEGASARAILLMSRVVSLPFYKETWQKAGMSIFKRKIIAQNEKEIATMIESGVINQEEYIRELSLQAKEGPDAVIEGNKVRLQFLKAEDIGEGLSAEDKEKVEAFNTIAGQFAEIPHKWKERGATKDERGKYEGKELAYRVALDQVLELLKEKGTDESALIDTNELDRRITFSQFFNTHPEAAEQLANIKGQSTWLALARDLVKTRGFTMALGGTIRTAAAAVASQVLVAGSMFVAAPLAGAATGGFMGNRRATTELKERELLAKAGVKDTSSEALNVVPAVVRLRDAEGNERIQGGLAGKLEELIRETEGASEADLGKIHEQLERRIAYTETKISEGLVDYGDKKEQIKNQAALLRALARAKTVALEFEPTESGADEVPKENTETNWRKDKRSVDERLADILKLHEQNISESQKAYVIKTTKQAAKYGAVFAFGGALVADIVQSGGGVIEHTVDDVRTPLGGGTSASSVAEQMTIPPAPRVPSIEATHTPSGAALHESMPTPASNAEAARTLHEGWKGGLTEKALGDAVFTRDYLNGMSELTGRGPGVGLSSTELNALLATDEGTVKNAAHLALIEAIRKSPTVRLSDETVARIMTEHHVPTALKALAPVAPASSPEISPTAVPVAVPHAEVVPIYEVKSGDSFSQIVKTQVSSMSELSEFEKENVIQNFLQKLSPEELQKIGISDPGHIEVGNHIDMRVLSEILESKRISGESLVAHAHQLGGTSASGTPVPQEVATAAHETVVSTSKFSDVQVESVQKALLSAKSGGQVPNELLQGSRAADAKAYMEYMRADVSEKQKIAEVLGTTTSEMDKKIYGILSDNAKPKGTTLAPETPASVLHTPVKSDIPKPTTSSPEKVLSIPLDRPRAGALAQEYLMKDMTDVRTGKPYPFWLEMKQYSAKDILTLKQDRVDPAMWTKILTIRKYVHDQGLTPEHEISPLDKESLEAFLKRGHEQHVMEFGVRETSPSALAREIQSGASPVPSRVLPRAPGEIVRLPRTDTTGTFDQGKGTPAPTMPKLETERPFVPSYTERHLPTPGAEAPQGNAPVTPSSAVPAPRVTGESTPQVPWTPPVYTPRHLPTP